MAMKAQSTKRLIFPTALALLAGCAGTQLGQTSARGPEDEVPGGPAGKPHETDPLASRAPAAKAPKRDISEDARSDFAKANERWDRAKREGTVKNDCDGLASGFARVADEYPALLEARHNQAA